MSSPIIPTADQTKATVKVRVAFEAEATTADPAPDGRPRLVL